MVTVNRSELERKLSVITSALSSNSSFPLLGYNAKGRLMFWQDSYMPIWDGLDSEGDDQFSFSVDPSVFRTIVNGFKTSEVDLNVNSKNAVIVKSGKSKVTVPYVDGPFDEIPEAPVVESSCKVGRDFLRSLAKSKDFVSKTYEQMSTTCSYIGDKDGQFFIAGAGPLYQYTNMVPYEGSAFPEAVIPPEYASIVPRLFSNESVQIGLSERGHLVMSDGPTIIYTRTVNEKYPPNFYELVKLDGDILFTANRRRLLESLRLAAQTTKEDMVGIGSVNGELDLYIPNAIIEADLVIDEVKVVKDFSRTYFLLSFLIKCIATFESEMITIEYLPQCNGAFKIGNTDEKETTILQPIRYQEP